LVSTNRAKEGREIEGFGISDCRFLISRAGHVIQKYIYNSLRTTDYLPLTTLADGHIPKDQKMGKVLVSSCLDLSQRIGFNAVLLTT
jgi:hypothetical protein